MSNSNQQGDNLGEIGSKAATTNSNLSTTSSWCFCHRYIFTFCCFFFVGILFINHVILPVQYCHNNEIQYNPFACHQLCVALLWESQTLRFLCENISWRFRVVRVLIPSDFYLFFILRSWPSDIPSSSTFFISKKTSLSTLGFFCYLNTAAPFLFMHTRTN